jgi:DNA-binding NtrC family response regulator
MPRALLIDDDEQARDAIASVVSRRGFALDQVSRFSDARSAIAQGTPDLVLVSRDLHDCETDELVEAIGCGNADIVVLAAQASVAVVVEALRAGASDFLVKPIDAQRLDTILTGVTRRLHAGAPVLDAPQPSAVSRFGALVGGSRPMHEVHALIARVAPTNATVFLYGESGTGKELVAQTIHDTSRRSRAPLVALNCSAVPPQLIESELFGHERGSFTGADRQHQGYFERADGGTLFLDEVTEMGLDLQAKLLRTLETGTIVRIGGERDIPVDVRIIAATNADPEEAVRVGRFRRDLLYRINVFPIRLPPLRDRGGDIEMLAQHFLTTLNDEEGASKRFTRAAIDRLRGHAWPGNVRELRNVVHHAFIVADHEVDATCVPLGAQRRSLDATEEEAPPSAVVLRPGTSIAEAERRLILSTLEACGGDKRDAARSLGISLKTLYNRLKTYSGWSNGARSSSIPVAKPQARWTARGGV